MVEWAPLVLVQPDGRLVARPEGALVGSVVEDAEAKRSAVFVEDDNFLINEVHDHISWSLRAGKNPENRSELAERMATYIVHRVEARRVADRLKIEFRSKS